MNKKITALAFAGFATLALSACSGNKAPTEEQAPAIAAAFPRRRPPKGAMMLICARPLPP